MANGRPGAAIRARGGGALGGAIGTGVQSIGQLLMDYGAGREREQEEEEERTRQMELLRRQEAQQGAKALGRVLVPESIVQSLGMDVSGLSPITIEGFERPRYAIPAPTSDGGIRVGGRTFPNTPEGQAAAIDWQAKIRSAGREPDEDVIRVGGRDFPNTAEGATDALAWQEQLRNAGREPDEDARMLTGEEGAQIIAQDMASRGVSEEDILTQLRQNPNLRLPLIQLQQIARQAMLVAPQEEEEGAAKWYAPWTWGADEPEATPPTPAAPATPPAEELPAEVSEAEGAEEVSPELQTYRDQAIEAAGSVEEVIRRLEAARDQWGPLDEQLYNLLTEQP